MNMVGKIDGTTGKTPTVTDGTTGDLSTSKRSITKSNHEELTYDRISSTLVGKRTIANEDKITNFDEAEALTNSLAAAIAASPLQSLGAHNLNEDRVRELVK